MIRTLALAAVIFAGVLVVMVIVEVALAYTRPYLATEPALELGGTFGPPDGRPLRFVVLGDSTAAGLGAGAAEHAYATLLAERLGADGYRVHLFALGVSGARVKDVADEQVPFALDADPDLVFVGIGANDSTHLTSLADVGRDMSRALAALAPSGAAVVVAGPPDMRAHAWHEPLRSIVGWRGRRVAARIEAVAHARGLLTVPLAARAGPYFAAHPEDAYAADDFHPGPGGYRAWADAIYPVLVRALAARQ